MAVNCGTGVFSRWISSEGKTRAGLAELELSHSGSGLYVRTFKRGPGFRLAARLARDRQPLQRPRVR